MSKSFKKTLMIVSLLALGVGAGIAQLEATCYHYENSRITYEGGYAVCGGTGPGCTECAEGGGNGDSCVTNGTSCVLHDY